MTPPAAQLAEPAARRLREAVIGWITTVNAERAPVSSPVWFVWHGGALYLASQPGAAKLRHIAANPRVSFHLDSDGMGGEIVTLDGTAAVVDAFPADVENAYMDKYGELIRTRMQTTPEALRAQFSSVVRVEPIRIRSW